MPPNLDVAWRRLPAPDRAGAGPPPPCDGGPPAAGGAWRGGGWRPRIAGGRVLRPPAMEAPSRGGRDVAASWGPQVGVHCLWYSE